MGGDIMLSEGLIILVILGIVALFKYSKSKDPFYVRFYKRAVIICVAGAILLFIPKLSILKFQYRNHPEYGNAYEKWSADPQNDTLRFNMRHEFDKTKMSKAELELLKLDEEKFHNKH